MKKLLVFIVLCFSAFISNATNPGKIVIDPKGSDEYQLTITGNTWTEGPYTYSQVEWVLFCENRDTFIIGDTINVKVEGLLYIACKTRYFYGDKSWFLSAVNQCLKGPEPEEQCFTIIPNPVIPPTPPTPDLLEWELVNGCITPNQSASIVFWYDSDPWNFQVLDMIEGETICFLSGIINFYFVTFNEVTEVYKVVIP